MQFKPEMIKAIKAGQKTQTRRPVKSGEWLSQPIRLDPRLEVVDRNHRSKWTLGYRYSICPGRGKNRVGLIHLLGIRKQAVYEITEADAHAEGFESREAFLAAWKRLYPKSDLTEPVWVLEFRQA